MSTPFGTSGHVQATAWEQVFKRANSWVNIQAQETPGANYINRYIKMNKEKMKTGEVPPVLTMASGSFLGWLRDGRPPMEAFGDPDVAAGLFSAPAYITVYITFDKNIKTTRDFAGKRVGMAERSRIFMSELPLRPYFDKGLGIWDKVNWQFIGESNSKDALLNNRIDVHTATFMGNAEQLPDGTFLVTAAIPSPPEMELMNSGRDFYIVSLERDVVRKAYDFKTDMMMHSAKIQKGAIQGVDYDVYGSLAVGMYRGPSFLPKDVVEEIIRVRHQYRAELAKFHAALSFYPKNPYPAGIPSDWVIPGVKEAVKALGLEVPTD